MRIRAVWSGLARENRKDRFGSKSVRIDMAPMTVKMPLTPRSVVPAILKEPGERAHLEEDLTRIGCIGLLSKPWSVKDERMVRELTTGAPNQYEGLSAHSRKLGMRRNGGKPTGSAPGEKGLHPEPTSSSAENSGTQQTLKTDSPSPTVRIPGPRGCWNSSFPSSIRKSQPR